MFAKRVRIALMVALAPAMASATAAPTPAAVESQPAAGACLFAQDECQSCIEAAGCQQRYQNCMSNATTDARRQMCGTVLARCQETAELRCRRQCNPRG